MKISTLITIFASSTISLSIACESQPTNTVCSNAIFSKGYAVAYFPVVKNNKNWEWFRKEWTTERAEYAWIAEPGKCVKNKFIASGVTYAASVGTGNLANNPPAEGTLADLLKVSSKNAYYSAKPVTEADEQHANEFRRKSFIHSKIMSSGDIALSPIDDATLAAVKRGHPTHMRMRAILPELSESYECIVKIDTVKLP
jgi:hypothetical protein